MGLWRGEPHLRPGGRLARVRSSLRHPVASVAAGGERARRLASDRALTRAVRRAPMAAASGVRPAGLATRDWPRYGLHEDSVT